MFSLPQTATYHTMPGKCELPSRESAPSTALTALNLQTFLLNRSHYKMNVGLKLNAVAVKPNYATLTILIVRVYPLANTTQLLN